MKHQKTILVLFLVLILAPPGYAGHLRVMAGPNLSIYSGPLLYAGEAWKFRLGFEGGIGYEMRLAPRLSLEIDALFVQKGSHRKYMEQGPLHYTIHYALNELNLPILLKLSLKKVSWPHLLAGGELSCILSSDLKTPGIEIYPPPWPDAPKMKRFYPGLVFGGGWGFDTPKGAFFVEARYHVGLTNIVRSGPERIKPRSIVLLIGMTFR
jgi:hypothetical protein